MILHFALRWEERDNPPPHSVPERDSLARIGKVEEGGSGEIQGGKVGGGLKPTLAKLTKVDTPTFHKSAREKGAN